MAEQKKDSHDPTSGWTSARGRTAQARYRASQPCRAAYKAGLYRGKRLLDWGCGHGMDVKWLKLRGVNAAGYDPAHRPIIPKGRFTAGQAIYVVNVIEKPSERVSMLRAVARRLAPGSVLVVAARNHASVKAIGNTTRSGDGVKTSVNTFQKGFSPSELAALCRRAGLRFEEQNISSMSGASVVVCHTRK